MSKPCSWCQSVDHTSFYCKRKVNKPIARATKRIRPISVKSGQSLGSMKRRWRKLNPPDELGGWYCYLHISPGCLGHVTTETLSYEHVIPRWKAPELKYDESNIQPSCAPCNKLKGSTQLVFLVGKFPHLRQYM